jgi:hypothetical protein
MNMIVAGVATAFAAMGLVALARPAAIGTYFDVEYASVDGRNEVRAVYGGFGLAMSLALVLTMQMPELRAGILACVSLALAGMAAGRVLSAKIERPGFWPWLFCGIEAIGAGLLASTITAAS